MDRQSLVVPTHADDAAVTSNGNLMPRGVLAFDQHAQPSSHCATAAGKALSWF